MWRRSHEQLPDSVTISGVVTIKIAISDRRLRSPIVVDVLRIPASNARVCRRHVEQCEQPWLESAANEGFPCYALFQQDRNLDNLRKDERFIALLARLKQQWEYYKTIGS